MWCTPWLHAHFVFGRFLTEATQREACHDLWREIDHISCHVHAMGRGPCPDGLQGVVAFPPALDRMGSYIEKPHPSYT